jgi:hypothetical protein
LERGAPRLASVLKPRTEQRQLVELDRDELGEWKRCQTARSRVSSAIRFTRNGAADWIVEASKKNQEESFAQARTHKRAFRTPVGPCLRGRFFLVYS